jgi:hypothetical protein
MLTAAIFDPSANEPGEALYEPVFDAIRCDNVGTHSEAQLQLAFSDIWVHALDWVAARHGFTTAMLEAGWRVMQSLEVDCRDPAFVRGRRQQARAPDSGEAGYPEPKPLRVVRSVSRGSRGPAPYVTFAAAADESGSERRAPIRLTHTVSARHTLDLPILRVLEDHLKPFSHCLRLFDSYI